MALVGKAELIRLQKLLGTDQAIGDRFNVTRVAIYQLRKKYGITSRRAENAQRNEKIVAMYKSGKTGDEVAKEFGLSHSQAYLIINSKSGKRPTKTPPFTGHF